LAIQKKSKSMMGLSINYYNLGLVCIDKGELKMAHEFCKKALELSQKYKIPSETLAAFILDFRTASWADEAIARE